MSTKWTPETGMPWIAVLLLLGLAALLSGCGTVEVPTPPAIAECPECPEPDCPEPVLHEDLWALSGHADSGAEAFVHWDEDDPPEVPVACAKCHSRPGFLDFLGVDGTEAGTVESAAQVGTTVTCFVCHNEASTDMDSVAFASGTKARGLGPDARCVECHQGRAATVTVDDAIAEAGVTDDDATSEELGFMYAHYASGAMPFGAEGEVAYQYSARTYSGRFDRGGEFFGCSRCHDKHTLELQFETCQACHTSARTEAREIRVDTTDYDGDGDIEEGIVGEIETIQEALYVSIQAYANDVVGTPIVRDPGAYPYFFVDSDGDGELDPDEGVRDNQYSTWTPRLLRAVYNYLFVSLDPGAFAHNKDYAVQVLYDSLADMGGDVSGMTRPATE